MSVHLYRENKYGILEKKDKAERVYLCIWVSVSVKLKLPQYLSPCLFIGQGLGFWVLSRNLNRFLTGLLDAWSMQMSYMFRDHLCVRNAADVMC